ncbi:hypothetical protein DYB37_011809, partial [Aphanomyces astaci]
YVYKQEGHYWKRALVVFEQSSYKLWSFIPSQQKAYAAINNVTWQFCTTALHERDEWLSVLQTASATIAAIEMAIHTPVCHCQECFEATGGAMSELFPTLIHGGGPPPHTPNGGGVGGFTDLDRVGPDLEGINTSRQSGGSKRPMLSIEVDDDEGDDEVNDVTFPTTPLEVEDDPFLFAPTVTPLDIITTPAK